MYPGVNLDSKFAGGKFRKKLFRNLNFSIFAKENYIWFVPKKISPHFLPNVFSAKMHHFWTLPSCSNCIRLRSRPRFSSAVNLHLRNFEVRFLFGWRAGARPPHKEHITTRNFSKWRFSVLEKRGQWTIWGGHSENQPKTAKNAFSGFFRPIWVPGVVHFERWTLFSYPKKMASGSPHWRVSVPLLLKNSKFTGRGGG